MQYSGLGGLSAALAVHGFGTCPQRAERARMLESFKGHIEPGAAGNFTVKMRAGGEEPSDAGGVTAGSLNLPHSDRD